MLSVKEHELSRTLLLSLVKDTQRSQAVREYVEIVKKLDYLTDAIAGFLQVHLCDGSEARQLFHSLICPF